MAFFLVFGLLACAPAAAAMAAPRPSSATLHEGGTAETGFLTVTTEPAAKLTIDGVDTGKTTPVTRVPLPAGKHKVTLTSLDGKTTRTLGVTIVQGEEKRLSVSL